MIADPSVVSTQFPLNLITSNLDSGKWASNPPSQIVVPTGQKQTSFSFEAEGSDCSATGTGGTVVYTSSDSSTNASSFTFTFEISYSESNSGNVTTNNPSANYQLDNGGGVPQSGNSVSVNVTITQVGPVVSAK